MKAAENSFVEEQKNLQLTNLEPDESNTILDNEDEVLRKIIKDLNQKRKK